jgi:hypothetical protein
MSFRTAARFLPSTSVPTSAGTALGRFDHQFGEQFRRHLIDVLLSVAGVQAYDLEGELMLHSLLLPEKSKDLSSPLNS